MYNVTEILKIIMQDVGIIHYSLFLGENNAFSCVLLRVNYCGACSIYLSLDTNEMYLLSI